MKKSDVKNLISTTEKEKKAYLFPDSFCLGYGTCLSDSNHCCGSALLQIPPQ